MVLIAVYVLVQVAGVVLIGFLVSFFDNMIGFLVGVFQSWPVNGLCMYDFDSFEKRQISITAT